MSNRYTNATAESAANDFFDNGSANADTNESETMSQTQTPSTTVQTGEQRVITANETSDLYIAVGHLKAAASAPVKAHPNMTLNWSGRNEADLPAQVRYVKALHEVKKALGKRQRDADGNVAIGFGSEDWYAGTYGAELPTIETEPIDGGFLSALKAKEGVAKDDDGEETWPEGSTDELGQGLPVLLPVIDGEVLPVFVNEESIEAALEHVAAIPSEPAVAPAPEAAQEAEEPAEEAAPEADDDLEAFFNVDEADEKATLPDGVLEGYPNPADLSVEDIRDLVTDITDVSVAKALLDLELRGENRTTAVKALKGRRNRLQDSDDDAGTPAEGASEPEPEPEAEPAAEGGSTPEAKAELANSLIADGMAPADALEQVRNL